jgi:hypothetical protein
MAELSDIVSTCHKIKNKPGLITSTLLPELAGLVELAGLLV